MDWEYVALEDRAETAWQHNNLVIQGWAQWMLVPWNDKVGRICIMRRPKDKPRMWREAELIGLMKQTWLVNPSPGQRIKEESNEVQSPRASRIAREETNG